MIYFSGSTALHNTFQKYLTVFTTYIKQFGEIIECRVLKDRNSKSNKGVAFVQFSLRVQANNGKFSASRHAKTFHFTMTIILYA